MIEEPRPKAHAVYVVATTAMARVAVGRLSIDGAPLSKLAFRVPVPKRWLLYPSDAADE